MSADNAILIAHFPDGYRVIHAQAIENIDYYPAGSKEYKKVLKDYFGNAKVFETEKEAYEEAERKANDTDILEYGVINIGEREF